MRELYVKMIFHSKQRRNFIILIFEIGLNIGSTLQRNMKIKIQDLDNLLNLPE